MYSIAENSTIVRKILLKLQTRDVARCCCVSWLWRCIVADPSFRTLHAGDAAGEFRDVQAHNLLVCELRGWSASCDMVVLSSPTSARPMCRVTDLAAAAEYSPANACNGFLFIAPREHGWPVCICNPVTGEKLPLSEAPAVEHEVSPGIYALAFCPSTLQYKLFRLSFPPNGCYMDVCTLGGHRQLWRQHPERLPCRAVSPPPVLLDSKLYLTCGEGMLVIDVATEVHCMYRLPNYEGENVAPLLFELRGRLCVAMHVAGRHMLYFWVKKEDDTMLDWELHYSFHMDQDGENSCHEDKPMGAWLNDIDGMLCYKMNDRLYKYSTTKNNRQVGGLLEWDNIAKLPTGQQWNVYCGYRPSLVSPQHVLVSLDDRHREFEESFLRALRDQKSSNKPRF